MGKFLTKPSPANISPQVPDDSGDDAFKLQFPALVEWLSTCKWEDGTDRQTSTLLVLWEEGVWKACLHDRDADRSAWASGWSAAGVLASLEEKLVTGSIEWRRKSVGKRR